MNKVFKLVWSKTKHCYVVASELAKRRTKAPANGIVSHAVVAGVLACVLSLSMSSPVFAEIRWGTHMGEYNHMEVIGYDDVTGYLYYGQGDTGDEGSLYLGVINGGVSINGLSVNGRTITYTKTDGSTGTITTQDTDTTYSAGHGVSLSGTTFSAKAGTNVTVNSNCISVTGNGTVASGNTGLIDGGKLYSEVRPSANGNYVIQLELYNFISSFPLFCSFLTIP